MSLFTPVFAGLGSDILFSKPSLDASARDALLAESQLLLQACHAIFHAEVFYAMRSGILSHEIHLEDFDTPAKLLSPKEHYYGNVVIQHVALYLSQILRCLGQLPQHGELLEVAGFCAGLLPAAVVSTSRNPIEFLSRAQDLFYVSVWLGIRSESYRRSYLALNDCEPTLPWSVVVDGIDAKGAQEIIAASTPQVTAMSIHPVRYWLVLTIYKIVDQTVFVTAFNSLNCVTLSGTGEQLQKFLSDELPSKCRTRTTNVRALYHVHNRLTALKENIYEDLKQRCSSMLTSVGFVAPLLSTIDGQPMNYIESEPLGTIINAILDMIMLHPVDWVSVQTSIFAGVQKASASSEFGTSIEILNMGPGYGMSTSAFQLPSNVKIRDVTSLPRALKSYGEASRLEPDDIAIVGMAVDLPDASDVDSLWANLVGGVNSCSEIPESRFHINDFYHAKELKDGNANRTLNTRYGNFLHNPFQFDNGLFDISPREARSMDLQQRIMLQTAFRALENSGYVPDSTPSNDRDTFGCWIGNATLDYPANMKNDIDVYYSPGTLRTFQSARISYVFGWSGPSITLDTACSSSIVALHQAARSIIAGDCRAALVGAVNIITSPDMYLGLDRAHFLSPSGQCKAFDASADGYCRAEGCGAFVIKRVSDAISDGDRIHAIIKAVEINQSGNTHSITHPHVPTQEELFKHVFRKTRIDPHMITAIELHGTGTQAGDPVELESVRRVLCQERSPDNLLHLTSIKANIGHCEAASGAAGLAKLVLMMKHNHIPPQISLKVLNPRIRNLGDDGAVINREGVPWPQVDGQPRMAMLNNFGAGGSNGAVLLQEYIPAKQPVELGSDSPLSYVFGCSTKSIASLTKLRDGFISYIMNKGRFDSLRDICATSTSRRQIYDMRIAVVATSHDDLVEKLQTAIPHNISESAVKEPKAVFAFSGQGSQYMGMGAELMGIYPSFAKTVRECDAYLKERNYPGCVHIISAADTGSEHLTESEKLQAFQSAIFVLEVALAELVMSWNIVPSAVVGHSLGEYAALVIAGVLDTFSGLGLVAHRAKLMMEQCQLQTTSMLAVNASAGTVEYLLQSSEAFSGLSISCDNGANDCVVGGLTQQLQILKEYIRENLKAKSKLLDVPMAYHSKAMDPILSELTEFASTIDLGRPNIPVVSNVLGRTVQAGEIVFTKEYFALHCRQTVNFHKGLQQFFTTNTGSTAKRWIEIGPHPSLLPMLGTCLDKTSVDLFPTLRQGNSPSNTMAQLLSNLYTTSTGIDWRKPFSGMSKPLLVDLPGIPFSKQEFGIHYPSEAAAKKIDAEAVRPVIRSDSFIAQTVSQPTLDDRSAIYDTPLYLLKDFITGHLVAEHALCPASVYHQIALSAVRDLEPESAVAHIWSLSKVTYVAPLLHHEEPATTVRAILKPLDDSRGFYEFDILSYDNKFGPNLGTSHCKGILKRRSSPALQKKYARLVPMLVRKTEHMVSNTTRGLQEMLMKRAMYELVFTRVVTYSEPYQRVKSIRIDGASGDTHAICQYPDYRIGTSGLPAANAIFMDVLLHVAGFAANIRVGTHILCMCKEVASATVLRSSLAPGDIFEVHCTLNNLASQGLTIADAYAIDSQGVLAVFKGMAFQQIELSKIGRALAITAKKLSGGSARKAEVAASVPLYALSDQGPIKIAMPAASGPTVRAMIATTCGVQLSIISEATSLESLGYDSLMMIELQSEIATQFPQVSTSELEDCRKVGDIERVCAVQVPLSPPITPPPGLPTGSTSSVPNTPPSMMIRPVNKSDVSTIIADTCGTSPDNISSSSDLHHLGIDSLMILELEARLEEFCKDRKTASAANLSNCRTVGDVERLHGVHNQVQGVMKSSSQSHSRKDSEINEALPFPRLIDLELDAAMVQKVTRALKLSEQPEVIKSGPSVSPHSLPLFLIHDGSGVCMQYHRLQFLDRQTYALHDPKFIDTADGWFSLRQMAESYAHTIRHTTKGPCLVGGWSFGGVVAFEAARILMATNHAVKGVVLIDSPPPLDHQPLSADIIETITGGAEISSHAMGKTIRELTRRNFLSCAALLGVYKPMHCSDFPAPPVVLLRSVEGWRRDGDTSDPRGVMNPNSIENAWLQDRSDVRTATVDWEVLTGTKVRCFDIPGNHFRAFDSENIREVSKRVLEACALLEGRFES
ncbi:polyketide synthase [Penicillium psychrosexuale]|uniref:polyketide synthase n=1 Tax=Penicillium psychrosexuale TaxID=1002107 RepID=UPI0025450E42|nr:polyketide synthase [Penicillium psychrosexuale]KAJ5799242.1 polyketide synthase [Penicillium psychrosexuale]